MASGFTMEAIPKNDRVEAISLRTTKHIVRLRKAMNRMRNENKFTDVTIICGTKRFNAHRLVLTSSSTFFDDLLKAEEDSNPTTVEMEDVDDDIMETVLELMYVGKVDLLFSSSPMILKMLTTVHLLDIKEAAQYLSRAWMKRGNLHKFPLFWDWADEFNDDGVMNSVIEQVAINFNQIPKRMEYLNLSPERMKAVLAHPKMNVGNCHDILVRVILSWVNHDPKMRKSFLDKFISYVDVRLLSDSCRETLIREKPLLQFFCEMKKSLALNEQGRTYGKGQLAPLITEEKKLKQAMHKELRKVDTTPRTELNTDRSLSKWSTVKRKTSVTTCTATNTRMAYTTNSVVTFQEALQSELSNVLLAAGRGEFNRFTIHIYLPNRNVWSLGEVIPTTSVEKRACVYLKGMIYLIGGEDDNDNSKLSHLHTHNIALGIFNTAPPLRIPRCSAGVASWRHMIFVVGGLNKFDMAMSHVEAFDTESFVWRLIQPMRYQKYQPGITVFNDTLYAIGGHTIHCECINLEKDTLWVELPPLPECFRETPMIATNHNYQIITFRQFRPDRVCMLDIGRNEWRAIRTGGTPPDDIEDSFMYHGELYALDKGGRLHVLDLDVLVWDQSISCPKSLSQVFHITSVNLLEINSMNESKTSLL